MNERLPLPLLLLVGAVALAQEAVPVDLPARTVSYKASGEHIDYLADGGCTATPVSTVSAPAAPVSTAQCNLSRGRSRAAVAAAIDAGALDP